MCSRPRVKTELKFRYQTLRVTCLHHRGATDRRTCLFQQLEIVALEDPCLRLLSGLTEVFAVDLAEPIPLPAVPQREMNVVLVPGEDSANEHVPPQEILTSHNISSTQNKGTSFMFYYRTLDNQRFREVKYMLINM